MGLGYWLSRVLASYVVLLGSWFGLIGLLVGLANGWCAGCGVFGFWVLSRIFW